MCCVHLSISNKLCTFGIDAWKASNGGVYAMIFGAVYSCNQISCVLCTVVSIVTLAKQYMELGASCVLHGLHAFGLLGAR